MGIVMDSRHAMLTLPQEKLNSIIDQRQLLLSREEVTVRDISQLIGKLSYPAEAVLPVSPLQVPRKAKNLEFPMQKNFERRVCLSQEAKKEFIW